MKCSFCKQLVSIFLVIFMININANDNEVVLEDGDIKVNKLEITNAIKYWPKNERSISAKDYSLRYDLLNSFIINYKIADKNDKITSESDPIFYWQVQFAIRNLKNKMFTRNFIENLVIPDMLDLAKEELIVNKDKYAALPEKRKASHILLKCITQKDCNRAKKIEMAEKIIKDLKGGANFEELVKKFSEDPGSKKRKGKIKNELLLGQSKVDGHFVAGAFSIETVGGYSGVVSTRFGLHIIRLDEIIASSYRPDKEVLPDIVKKLEKRYKLLSKKKFVRSLGLTEKVKINHKLLDEILSEYDDGLNLK